METRLEFFLTQNQWDNLKNSLTDDEDEKSEFEALESLSTPVGDRVHWSRTVHLTRPPQVGDTLSADFHEWVVAHTACHYWFDSMEHPPKEMWIASMSLDEGC